MRNANEIAKEIRAMEIWDMELLEELCEAADMVEEWNEADGEAFESIAFKAAEKLGVEIA